MSFEKYKIAVILYDNLPETCSEIRENLRDLTHFKLQGKFSPVFYETQNLSDTLRQVSELDFDWAVVIAVGTNIQDQSIIWQTVQYAMDHDSPLSGHILDRGGYYHLHPQWFAIELQKYKLVNFTGFEEVAGTLTMTTKETQRSSDNMHDDYTPSWIMPKSENLVDYTSDHGYFGIRVLSEFIKAGYKIVNVPASIRQKKFYSYPEHNLEDIRKLIADSSHEPANPQGPMWWFAKSVRELKKNLQIGYYVLNTEILYFIQAFHDMKFDCFIGVCSGIKPVCIVGQENFSDNTSVYLFDISPAALSWQQYLFDNWDGELANFESVYNQFASANPELRPIYFMNDSLRTNINRVLDSANITAMDFKRHWDKYKKMKVEFVQLDLLQDTSLRTVISWANTSSTGSYVWTSNLFNMDYLCFFKTNRWTREKIQNLEQQLDLKISGSYMLENCGKVISRD